MPEVSVASLDPHHQRLIANASLALERGNVDYVVEVTAHVLRHAPGCLPVRRLQRVAQMHEQRHRDRSLLRRIRRGVATLPLLVGRTEREPEKRLRQAEAMLAMDPVNRSALKLLADAAGTLGLPETAAFAWEAICELEPDRRTNVLALSEAWLVAGRPQEALQVADEWLRRHPGDTDAQTLMRKASVAQTLVRHDAEQPSTYRETLRDEAQAISLEQGGKVVRAEAMTQRLLDEALLRVAAEPANLNHYRSVVDACRQLGRLEEALFWVRKAREQPVGRADPAWEKQELELAIALHDERVRTAEARLAANPGEPQASTALQTARTARDEFTLSEATRHVERHPHDHAARLALAQQLFEVGQIEAAIAHFQQAQKGSQGRGAALLGLGRCFKARGLLDLAVAQLGAAKQELALMDGTKKEVVYELGTCYESLGRPEAAAAEYTLIYSEDIGFRDVAEKINAFYATV